MYCLLLPCPLFINMHLFLVKSMMGVYELAPSLEIQLVNEYTYFLCGVNIYFPPYSCLLITSFFTWIIFCLNIFSQMLCQFHHEEVDILDLRFSLEISFSKFLTLPQTFPDYLKMSYFIRGNCALDNRLHWHISQAKEEPESFMVFPYITELTYHKCNLGFWVLTPGTVHFLTK